MKVLAFAAVAATATTLLLALPPLGGAAPAAAAATGAGSNCTRSCGDISIPYPFGIEPGCFHADGGFNLTCDHSFQPPKLFIGDGTVPVIEISPDSTVRIKSRRVSFPDHHGDGVVNKTWGLGLPPGGHFGLSWRFQHRNMLLVENCNAQVDLLGGTDNRLLASCTAICPKVDSPDGSVAFTGDGDCAGIRCCQANIDISYPSYNITLHMLDGEHLGTSGSVYIVERDFDRAQWGVDDLPVEEVPTTLAWVIANSSCPTDASAPECRSNYSLCVNRPRVYHGTGPVGRTCHCNNGYQGNPYIDDGPDSCQDIDECLDHPCYGDCTNTPGTFTCTCPTGYEGNAFVPNKCKDIDECENPKQHGCYGICTNFPGGFQCQCPNGTYGIPSTNYGCATIIRKNSFTGLSIGLGVGGGTTLLLVLSAPFISRKFKLQKEKRIRDKFFHQNRGLLLQQLISHNADIGERMIITLRDLEKATNNFDRARVIGGGGHGLVFKGIIDLNVVAIKKPKIIVQREIDEFINEVVVLSQVNHRNVVKLIGCCLETEVPLLVYEFISNGTLYHHLHVEGPISLPWADKTRIALEVVRALSYLHSAASMPIFHRDIKSTNILLDDNLIAKVSDFGASRYIPIDQTEVTTEVQGTRGYLDPMYYYTGRLTDKSDVFSFGVLLIELLTRKQPFSYRSEHGDNLVSHFIKLLQIGNLIGLIDPQVIEEEDGEVQDVAALAAMCTNMRGEDRPTMREVETMLESILVKKKQVPSIATARRQHDKEDRAQVHYMSIELVTNTVGGHRTVQDMNTREASRQYTMEEEILLSASYPR